MRSTTSLSSRSSRPVVLRRQTNMRSRTNSFMSCTARGSRAVRAEGQLVTSGLARTAIIVIDMQHDFCHPDGWLAHFGGDVAPVRAPIAPLQVLLPALRGHDVPVIWLNWGNRPDKLNLSPAL